MLLMSLGRLLGILIFLGAALFGIILSYAHRSLALLALMGTITAGGLALAIFSDKGIDRKKAAMARDKQQRALQFHDSVLTVPLRWVRWFLSSVGLAVLVWVPAMAAQANWSSGKFLPAVLIASLGALLAVGLFSLLASGWAAWKSGYMLNMDLLGLAHSSLPVIPWPEVRGIDLQENDVKSQKSWLVVIALNNKFFESIYPSALKRWLHWSAPRFNRTMKTISVPCVFMDASPPTVAQAARVIADKAGSRRVKEWRYFESIEKAYQLQQAQQSQTSAQERMDELLAQLKTMDQGGSLDEDKLRHMDAQMQEAMNRISQTAETLLQVPVQDLQKRLKPLRYVVWAMYSLLAFVIATALMKIFSAWNA